MLRFHLILSVCASTLCRTSVFGFFVNSHILFCLRRFFKCSYQFECVRIVWWLIEFLQNNNRKMEFACTTYSCLVCSTEKKIVLIQSLCLSFNQYHSLFVATVSHLRAYTHTHTFSRFTSFGLGNLNIFYYYIFLIFICIDNEYTVSFRTHIQ